MDRVLEIGTRGAFKNRRLNTLFTLETLQMPKIYSVLLINCQCSKKHMGLGGTGNSESKDSPSYLFKRAKFQGVQR